MAISMLKIRRPLGRLIFNMGIAIPGKTVFLIETAPWFGWIWIKRLIFLWMKYIWKFLRTDGHFHFVYCVKLVHDSNHVVLDPFPIYRLSHLRKVSVNEKRRYKCNVCPHLLRSFSAWPKTEDEKDCGLESNDLIIVMSTDKGPVFV